jgi:hypothetical protein
MLALCLRAGAAQQVLLVRVKELKRSSGAVGAPPHHAQRVRWQQLQRQRQRQRQQQQQQQQQQQLVAWCPLQRMWSCLLTTQRRSLQQPQVLAVLVGAADAGPRPSTRPRLALAMRPIAEDVELPADDAGCSSHRCWRCW